MPASEPDAVHKPLLVLLALGRLLRGESPLVEFAGLVSPVYATALE